MPTRKSINIGIMAEYIKQEMPDITGKGESACYYRMKINRNVTMEDFIEQVAQPGSGLNPGTVKHVITQVTNKLAWMMASGNSVTIEGLGTFKPTLGVSRFKEMDTLEGDEAKRNAQSIEVNGVNFRVDPALVRQTDLYCTLHRGKSSRLHKSPYTREERLALAQQYLDTHAQMCVDDYVRLTSLSRTTAVRELQAFRDDPQSGIGFRGLGSHKVYVRRQGV